MVCVIRKYICYLINQLINVIQSKNYTLIIVKSENEIKTFPGKNYICNACSFENKQNETLFQASQNTKSNFDGF